MDFIRNEKYFRSTNTHFYIGLIMLCIGGTLAVLQRVFWFYYYLFLIGIALAVAGAITAFVPQWKKSSDKDIDDQISKEKDGYLKSKIDELGLAGALSPNADSILISEYEYDDSLIKRGLDGKIRASSYCITAVIVTKTGVVTAKKSFSLINESRSEEIKELLFSEADRAETIMRSVPFREDKDDTEIKTMDFVIYRGGAAAFRAPAAMNAIVENLASNINALIKRAKAEE